LCVLSQARIGPGRMVAPSMQPDETAYSGPLAALYQPLQPTSGQWHDSRADSIEEMHDYICGKFRFALIFK